MKHSVDELIDKVARYLTRELAPGEWDYERGALHETTLGLLEDLKRINPTTLAESAAVRKQRERLKHLADMFETMAIMPGRDKFSGLPDDALPELRAVAPSAGAKGEARRLATLHSLDVRQTLAVEVALLKRADVSYAEIGRRLKDEGRLFQGCADKNLKRSVIALLEKHVDVLEKCRLT